MSDEFHEINREAYFSSMLADSSALPLVTKVGFLWHKKEYSKEERITAAGSDQDTGL